MRFRLRTLLIVLALGPPILAGLYFTGADAWYVLEALLIWVIILGTIPGLFALWYYMTLKSQANSKMQCFDPPTDPGL